MIPRVVNVNGVPYRVALRPQKEIEGHAGMTFTEQTLIVVAKELSPAQRRATYLHEVGHAAFYESGACETVKDFTAQPDRLEELLLQVFAPVYRHAIGAK